MGSLESVLEREGLERALFRAREAVPHGRVLLELTQQRAGQKRQRRLRVRRIAARPVEPLLHLTRIAAQVQLLPYRCERVLERAAGLGWVAKTEKDGWLLARDAGAIRLADIYRAFVLDPEAQGAAGSESAGRLSGTLAEHWKHVQNDMSLTLTQLSREEKPE